MSNSNKNAETHEVAAQYDFSTGVRGRFYRPHKVSTTIRLDNDVLIYFKKKSSETKQGYQTLINNALRSCMSHGESHSERE